MPESVGYAPLRDPEIARVYWPTAFRQSLLVVDDAITTAHGKKSDDNRGNGMRVRRTLVAAAAAALSGAALASAPVALAYGPSYCNSSSCSLSAGPTSGQIYFEMPRNTAVSMICWTDNQWFRGTNRWFKVDTVYGRGYMIATQVSNQTRVGHC